MGEERATARSVTTPVLGEATVQPQGAQLASPALPRPPGGVLVKNRSGGVEVPRTLVLSHRPSHLASKDCRAPCQLEPHPRRALHHRALPQRGHRVERETSTVLSLTHHEIEVLRGVLEWPQPRELEVDAVEGWERRCPMEPSQQRAIPE